MSTISTTAELWSMGATELAEGSERSRPRFGRSSKPRRIESVPSINAAVIVLGEEALETADAADRAIADGRELPPFHRVPFTIKANIDVTGTPTTMGLKALAAAYLEGDAGREAFVFPPESQRELAAGTPNARLHIVERAGHNPYSERTDESWGQSPPSSRQLCRASRVFTI